MTAFFRERPLVLAAVCYGLGVVLGFRLEWIWWLDAAALGSALLAALILKINHKSMLLPCCGAMLFLGMLLCAIASHPELPQPGAYTTVSGTVSGVVKVDENGKNKTYLQNVYLEDEEGVRTQAGKAYLTITPKTEGLVLHDGQKITFSGRVYLPSGQENPYGFDFSSFLITRGAGYGISATADPVIAAEEEIGFSGRMLRIREWLAGRCSDVFGDEAALPMALLLGIRDELPDEEQNAFSNAGVAHILAVSGLHVSLLAGALILLCKKIHLSPKCILFSVSAFLFLYCALLGFTAPVVRASVLTFLLLLSPLAKRRTDPLTSLSAAFILLLVIRPTDLFTMGFVLSFSAVLGIILIGDLFRSVQPENRFLLRLWKTWQTTFAATLGVLIPTACYFHTFSLIGLLINPAVCFLIGILLPVYAVVFALGCILLPAGAFLGGIMAPVTRCFITLVEWIGAAPFATVRVRTLSAAVIILFIAGILLLTRYCKMKKGFRLASAAVCLACSAALFAWRGDNSVRYIQLSVGQADCAVIEDGDRTIVIDTGEDGGDLQSYLLARGRKADIVFLTHLHSDHTDGMKKLVQNDIEIGTVYIPVGAQQHAGESGRAFIAWLDEHEVPICYVAAGDEICTQRVRCRVLWPDGEHQQPVEDANAYSMAMMIELEGTHMMYMSDVPSGYENYFAAGADILKVAHHGSKTSTSVRFLEAVRPEVALLTAASFKTALPHPDTVKRLDEAGIRVYRTDEEAAITICFENGGYTVSTFRGVP